MRCGSRTRRPPRVGERRADGRPPHRGATGSSEAKVPRASSGANRFIDRRSKTALSRSARRCAGRYSRRADDSHQSETLQRFGGKPDAMVRTLGIQVIRKAVRSNHVPFPTGACADCALSREGKLCPKSSSGSAALCWSWHWSSWAFSSSAAICASGAPAGAMPIRRCGSPAKADFRPPEAPIKAERSISRSPRLHIYRGADRPCLVRQVTRSTAGSRRPP